MFIDRADWMQAFQAQATGCLEDGDVARGARAVRLAARTTARRNELIWASSAHLAAASQGRLAVRLSCALAHFLGGANLNFEERVKTYDAAR